jgi:DNA adenine methylase
MKAPQPFQYQGSKRKLALTILNHVKFSFERLVEPFAGSAAVSVAAAIQDKAPRFWLNDLNAPLVNLLKMMTEKPEAIVNFYEKIWTEQFTDKDGSAEHYYKVRERFNKTNDENLFLYLLARCVKGAVRYNSEGYFNQSPDKRRTGTQPSKMRENVYAFSKLLKNKVIFTSLDYEEVLSQVNTSDLVYLDPPYQGVCGDRDSRYYSQIAFDNFVKTLQRLNEQKIPYLLSYDGRRGKYSYGKRLPNELQLSKFELAAGRSTQATLLGKTEMTFESLYLSPEVVKHNQNFVPSTKRHEQDPLLTL